MISIAALPLTDNPNAPNNLGLLLIHLAAIKWTYRNDQNLGFFDRQSNAPNEWGITRIHDAADNGDTEIVKILAP